MSKSLYPIKLREGDRIEGDGWSATWDGTHVVGGCGVRGSPAELKRYWLYARPATDWTHSDSSEQACIIEQLVCEGAL